MFVVFGFVFVKGTAFTVTIVLRRDVMHHAAHGTHCERSMVLERAKLTIPRHVFGKFLVCYIGNSSATFNIRVVLFDAHAHYYGTGGTGAGGRTDAER